uniref:Uncharacterized protein n=1 Tax=Kalanchoe fedtschenkoi TaxID=63787 RepID=A0A7N0URD2_KALFE
MGASNSKLEEDKSLQLCRDRKKYVKKALNGRCLLADTHISYIQSLRNTGRALREFFELQGPTESSLYTSVNVTPQTILPDERQGSGLSFSSISITRSPSLSPFNGKLQANHMKYEGTASQKFEEKVASPVKGRVAAPDAPHSTIKHPVKENESVSAPSPETIPWDYFSLAHPVDDQLSAQVRNGWNEGHKSGGDTGSLHVEDVKQAEADDQSGSIMESEVDDEITFVHQRVVSDELFSYYDEPLSEGLVRSFENVNMASDLGGAASSHSIASASTEISEIMPEVRGRSPDLSPLGAIASSVLEPVNLTKLTDVEGADIEENPDIKETPDVEENPVGSSISKSSPNDLCSSMRDIDQLFVRASESGEELPRMLEANKLHYRRILPKRKGRGSKISRCLNACFSYQEEKPSQVPEDPGQVSTRYLTWQRTMPARSFSTIIDAAGENARDDALTNSINDIYCMRSGSHASTLDRLYAWEKKLYDEVKASQVVRNAYDMKCRLLRHQESQGEPARRVDKTRAVIKDLHSRIRVAIKRMDSISRKIEEIRDKELQPQLEELVKGIANMWDMMHECHKLQFSIISSVALNSGAKISINSETHQQITNHLEQQLSLMSSSFIKWMAAHKSYLQAIDGWLLRCVIVPEKSSRKKRKYRPVSVRGYGPPIFVTCGDWLEGLEKLPTKDLSDSIKNLAAETSRLLPRQEKHRADMNNFYPLGDSSRAAASNIWRSDFDNFRSSLVHFFSQLNTFSQSSLNMYKELDVSIQEAKHNYEHLQKPQP